MIDGNYSHPTHRALASCAGDSAPPRARWFSNATNSIASVLRHIPNPSHLILSAPGRALTILALASRGITSAPVLNLSGRVTSLICEQKNDSCIVTSDIYKKSCQTVLSKNKK